MWLVLRNYLNATISLNYTVFCRCAVLHFRRIFSPIDLLRRGQAFYWNTCTHVEWLKIDISTHSHTHTQILQLAQLVSNESNSCVKDYYDMLTWAPLKDIRFLTQVLYTLQTVEQSTWISQPLISWNVMNTIPKTSFIYLFVQTRHKNTTGARDIKNAYCLFVQMFEHRNDNDKSLIFNSILLFGAVFFSSFQCSPWKQWKIFRFFKSVIFTADARNKFKLTLRSSAFAILRYMPNV